MLVPHEGHITLWFEDEHAYTAFFFILLPPRLLADTFSSSFLPLFSSPLWSASSLLLLLGT